MELLTIKLKKLFSENINNIFGADYTEKVDIQNSTKREFGDFQTNFAMVSSKLIGKNPREIASTLVDNFKENDIIEKLEIAGPGFINIYLKNKFLNEELKKVENEKYDFSFLNTDKTIIIDYSSPNIAKRMHIGHLRSTIIGDSIKRTLQFLGFHTLADNHIGDWGTQLGDEENQKLWKEFIDISLKEYNKIYDRLGVNFDYYYGESFYNDMMPAVLEELKEKGIAREDQGALVVFFENDKLPPAIVQKKDGSFLYTTSDLATMKFRKDELNVDEAVYLTDDRQQNHFKQVFEIGEMLGEPYNYKKTHVVFGIMRFGDGMIFSSRSGNIIRLVDLLDQAKTQVKKVIDEKNPNIPEEEKEKIAEIVGSGAIKYFDLSQNRTSDITFTWDKVLSFEGNTGPYLQYTYVRIMSIFRKLKEENINVENKDIILENMNGVERELAVELLRFPQTVVKSYESYRPNIIADYLFDIAKLFNNFYNSNSILKEENKKVMDARILLAEKTAFILKEGLGLLGINTVDRM